MRSAFLAATAAAIFIWAPVARAAECPSAEPDAKYTIVSKHTFLKSDYVEYLRFGVYVKKKDFSIENLIGTVRDIRSKNCEAEEISVEIRTEKKGFTDFDLPGLKVNKKGPGYFYFNSANKVELLELQSSPNDKPKGRLSVVFSESGYCLVEVAANPA